MLGATDVDLEESAFSTPGVIHTPVREYQKSIRALTCVNPVEIVAALVAERDRLQAQVESLQLRLAAYSHVDLVEVGPLLKYRLSRQETALYELLASATPKCIGRYAIEAMLPRRDHSKDRQMQIVSVLVSRLRSKLGKGSIETVHGAGWRLNPEWRPQ